MTETERTPSPDDPTDDQINAGNRAIMKAVGERLRDKPGRSRSSDAERLVRSHGDRDCRCPSAEAGQCICECWQHRDLRLLAGNVVTGRTPS